MRHQDPEGLGYRNDKGRPACHGCEHYYVTWDAAFPFGCKGFQMKSKRDPSLSVYFASGKRCMLFEQKKRPMERGLTRNKRKVMY